MTHTRISKSRTHVTRFLVLAATVGATSALTTTAPAHAERVLPTGSESGAGVVHGGGTTDIELVVHALKLRMAAARAAQYRALSGEGGGSLGVHRTSAD